MVMQNCIKLKLKTGHSIVNEINFSAQKNENNFVAA